MKVVLLLLRSILLFDRILFNTLHKEQCYHSMFDCLYFYELFNVDFIVQLKFCFFINLSQSTKHTVFTLIHFAFWKVQFAYNPISRVMVDDEQEFIQSLVENKSSIRWYLLLIEAVFFPQCIEVGEMRLEEAPVFEYPLSEFLEVGIVSVQISL